MKREWLLLLNPYFITCLLLLLANDFFFKYEYHNWLTGKLSDFTGLFVFSTFFIALFPAHKIKVVCTTAILFTFWKSPLSEPVIFLLNRHMSVPVSRVIDYSDLLALSVLPFTLKVQPPHYNTSLRQKIAIFFAGTFTLFAFCATTLPMQLVYYPYRENEVSWNEKFLTTLSESEILLRFRQGNNGYTKDTARFYRVIEYRNFYYRIKNDTGYTVRWEPVINNADSSLYVMKKSDFFYTIPWYVINGDTLFNIEISLSRSSNKKKPTTVVNIESFLTNQPAKFKYFQTSKLATKYRRKFKQILKN